MNSGREPTSGELRDELLVEIAQGLRLLLLKTSGAAEQDRRLARLIKQFQDKSKP
jgi:hypothetical protein